MVIKDSKLQFKWRISEDWGSILPIQVVKYFYMILKWDGIINFYYIHSRRSQNTPPSLSLSFVFNFAHHAYITWKHLIKDISLLFRFLYSKFSNISRTLFMGDCFKHFFYTENYFFIQKTNLKSFRFINELLSWLLLISPFY